MPGSMDSAVTTAEGRFPVAPNASTVLPTALQFEWSAIETNSEAIEIMADGAKDSGAPLLGRTFVLTKWFRQLGVATLDRWKCVVHAAGGFREDIRMQMGRRASAHSGQRTTFLLTALLQLAAQKEGWGRRDPAQCTSATEVAEQRALAAWLVGRKNLRTRGTQQKAAYAQPQDCLVYFSSFQDDITAVALGNRAAQDTTEGVVRVLYHTYGVPLSTKKEASLDFSHSFASIGAYYDMTDPANVKCSPRDEKLEKYEAMIRDLEKAGTLITLHEMQCFAGLHTFMARFLQEGEFFCNSAYCCLRAAPHTSQSMRPISRDLLKDANTVLWRLKNRQVATLTDNPTFAHSGHQGFSADASGATGVAAAGWGVHVQGSWINGKWPAKIKQALADNSLSISPLELLAAAIATDVAGSLKDKLPAHRRLIMRSDNESACAVVASNRADSAPMLEALRIFQEVQEKTGLKVRLLHIPSGDNSIADNLSRGRVEAATREASTRFRLHTAQTPRQFEGWCDRLLQVALQATRHSATTADNVAEGGLEGVTPICLR